MITRCSVVTRSGSEEEIGNYRTYYPTIWFFVSNKKIQRAVEAARDSLHKDQHQRIHVVLHPSLLLT